MSMTSKARRDRRKMKLRRARNRRDSAQRSCPDSNVEVSHEETSRITISVDGERLHFRFEQLSESGPGLDFTGLRDLLETLGIALNANTSLEPEASESGSMLEGVQS